MKTNIIDFSLKINDKSIFFVRISFPLRIWEENRFAFKSLPIIQKHTLFSRPLKKPITTEKIKGEVEF